MPFSNAFSMVYFFLLRRVHPIKRLSGRAVSLLHLNGECLGYRQYKKPQKTPPPNSCAENKYISSILSCTCGKCIPFQLHSVPVGFVPQPNRHYILPTFHAYTSAPHSLGKYSFHFASYIHSVFPKLFSNAYQWYIFFYAKSKPRKN